MNISRINTDLRVAHGSMEELRLYKDCCARGDDITYYDPFENQNDKKDSRENVNRKKLLWYRTTILKCRKAMSCHMISNLKISG